MLLLLRVLDPEEIGGVNGCNYLSCKASAGDDSALLCDLEMSSDQRASGGRSKEDYNAGLDLPEFANEPWFTT